MKPKTIFKRYELKYLITKEQQTMLLALFDNKMKPDEYGPSSIHNLYYDTSDYLLIRRSLDKPIYKEKLRLRSYGRATSESKVFLELKKKYDDIVYKRRMSLIENNATKYFENEYSLPNTQISKEIEYFKTMYPDLAPRMLISYVRESFFGIKDSDFRVTFDENILWRDHDLDLKSEEYGDRIIPEYMVLMEVKVSGGIPLWLTHFLTENKIYKRSFSKYGVAYKEMIKAKKGENHAA